MGFQVDRATKIDFLALVKGNRQMGFQVDRATNIDFFGFG
jgi:hypothetical protein